MTDIVERLRSYIPGEPSHEECVPEVLELAAREIERLEGIIAASQPATEPPFLESLRKTAKVMKRAHDAGGDRWMSIWEEDLQAVEEAIAALSSAQCGEVT